MYPSDKWQEKFYGNKKSLERWKTCTQYFHQFTSVAADFLYLQRYRDKKMEESMRNFVLQVIDFAVKKITAENRWEEKVLRDVTGRLQSIQIIFGYRNLSLDPKSVEETYAELTFSYSDQFTKMFQALLRLTRESPTKSEARKLFALKFDSSLSFKYSPSDNILCE